MSRGRVRPALRGNGYGEGADLRALVGRGADALSIDPADHSLKDVYVEFSEADVEARAR
jgi:hypothetical protein